MRPIDFERLVTEHVADCEELVRNAQECTGGAHVYPIMLGRNLAKRAVHRERQIRAAIARRATWEQRNA